MFVSTEYLVVNYGVDEKIARYFVDREPPAGNLYWHEKLLYLRFSAGYIFIPLVVDLLYKSGIAREDLLGDEFITTMEQTGHISALEEVKKISAEDAIAQCADLVKNNCKNNEWHQDVIDYLTGEHNYIAQLSSPFKALHRGDMFLFSLCALPFPKEKEKQIVEQWFALITTLLLHDDAEDVQADMKTGEENAFLEHGFNASNIAMAEDLVRKNLEIIALLNKTMATTLGNHFDNLVMKPKQLLTTN